MISARTLKALSDEGLTIPEAADRLGMTKSKVNHWADKHSVKFNTKERGPYRTTIKKRTRHIALGPENSPDKLQTRLMGLCRCGCGQSAEGKYAEGHTPYKLDMTPVYNVNDTRRFTSSRYY